jgi:hypothetical protein
MFIFYNPDTLKIDHIVIYAPPEYKEFISSQPNQHWLEIDETYEPDEIELTSDLQVIRRISMDILYPEKVLPTEVITITNVPETASITINEVLSGTMDNSRVLEITPNNSGFYKFKFEASGYLPKEITVEVTSQH